MKLASKLQINGATYVRSDADYQDQIDKVCSHLGDDMFEALTEADAIIAGGAILSAFTHQDINDIDVYFRDRESMMKAFVKVTRDWESIYLGHTDKSITLKDKGSETIVQFIYFDFFATPEDIFQAFDFTVCMAAIELGTLAFVAHKDFISDMASRTLHFNPGTKFPYISLIRTKKYQERGYKIGRGHLLAIANACARMPINNWHQAKYQLGGVYGDQIILQIDNDETFTTERLHTLLTELKDYVHIDRSDYPVLFRELTGQEFGSKEAKEFVDNL